MKIEIWSVDKLIPYARNPRKGHEAALKPFVAAIKEFGFRVPILARSDGEVVDGHLRLKAALALGMTEVPVVLCDDMTPAQVKAFRISINRMADLAEWDFELLALEVDELKALDFDLDITMAELELPELGTPKIAERSERFLPLKMTYVLISVPVGAQVKGLAEAMDEVVRSGGEVDYAGN